MMPLIPFVVRKKVSSVGGHSKPTESDLEKGRCLMIKTQRASSIVSGRLNDSDQRHWHSQPYPTFVGKQAISSNAAFQGWFRAIKRVRRNPADGK